MLQRCYMLYIRYMPSVDTLLEIVMTEKRNYTRYVTRINRNFSRNRRLETMHGYTNIPEVDLR